MAVAGPGEGVGAGTGHRLASQLAPARPKTRDCLKPRVVYWQQIPWQFLGALLAGGLRSAAVPGDSFYSYLKNKNKYAWWKRNQLLCSSKHWRLTLPASAWRGEYGFILEIAPEGMLFSIISSIFPTKPAQFSGLNHRPCSAGWNWSRIKSSSQQQ